MTTPARCTTCGTELSGIGEDGLCPGCLLGLAFQDSDESRQPARTDMPARIGSYLILGELGQGGFGIVYLAEQERPRRRVALKVARPGVAGSDMMRRFEREAELLGRLHHPGIAQIYEAGTDDTGSGPRPFFAMELVHGQPVTDYVKQRQLDREARFALFVKICDAVQHAHDRGVLHRDLKPANILVDETGLPKILDFGVARVQHADDRTVSLVTSHGQILGTIPYMSPEQVSGSQEIDGRSDVYTLGVVLYELLTGRLPLPVEGKPIHEAARMIVQDDPERPGRRDRELRGDIENVLIKALEKNPERRYARVADLATDVQNLLAERPVNAHSQSLAYRLRKFGRRHPVTVAGTIVVGLVALTIVATLHGLGMNFDAKATNLLIEQHISRATRDLRAITEGGIDLGARSAAIHDLGALALRDVEPDHYRAAITQLTIYIRENLPLRKQPDAPEVVVDRGVYQIEDIRQALQEIQRLTRRSGIQPKFGPLDLSSLSLTHLDLSGLDFSHCILDDSFLSGSDFTGALLRFAKLRRIAAWGTDFSNVDFHKADLTNARFANSDFTGTNLLEAKALELEFCADTIGLTPEVAEEVGCKLLGESE